MKYVAKVSNDPPETSVRRHLVSGAQCWLAITICEVIGKVLKLQPVR